ncbi:MAG: hypothetical protein AB7T31_10150 [Gemmatimonadales bacterium]
MKAQDIAMPTLALIAATRGMLGFGAGLLASQKIPAKRRIPVGWTLLSIGVASTVPLALRVWRGSH